VDNAFLDLALRILGNADVLWMGLLPKCQLVVSEARMQVKVVVV